MVAWILITLINSSSLPLPLTLSNLWTSTVPGMKKTMYQFEHFFQAHLPRLKRHLDSMDMGFSDVCCSQMSMTLHAYSAPLRFMPSYFDHIVASGMPAVIGLGLERLRREESKVMGYGMEEVGRYLRTWREALEGDPEELVRRAHGLGIGYQKLSELEVEVRN